MPDSTDISTLRRLLHDCRRIAIVGISAEWHRPSYFVGKYMLDHGYTMIPVNPKYREVLGQTCYPDLATARVAGGIDMVDCFRKAEDIGPLAEQAIAIGANCLWMQLGVLNEEAAANRARCRARRGDGSLREDRARAAVRRPQLGRRQHRRDLGAASAPALRTRRDA